MCANEVENNFVAMGDKIFQRVSSIFVPGGPNISIYLDREKRK